MENRNILGALAQSMTRERIIFCEFENTEKCIDGIKELIAINDYKESLYTDNIKVISIASIDNFNTEEQVIGVLFSDDISGEDRALTRKSYKGLATYMQEVYYGSKIYDSDWKGVRL